MWVYNKTIFDEIPEGMVGFVYLITNLMNDRKYIGKKNFYFSKTRQIKGKKKRFKIESDWKSYYGSNKELIKDIEKFGEKAFRREILHLCKSKGDFAYLEAKEQFDRKVLESDLYYNDWIMCRIHGKHLTINKR
jgi:hypothetical protein